MILRHAHLFLIIHSFIALTFSYQPLNSTTLPFTANILNQNNTDITSSFQIRLYIPPPHHPRNTTTTTTLPPRRVLHRLIDSCPDHQQFLSSSCTPDPPRPGSLQSFITHCRRGPNRGPPTAAGPNALTITHGTCEPHEICIDTVSEITLPPRQHHRDPSSSSSGGGGGRSSSTTTAPETTFVPTASCVTDTEFEPWDPETGGESLAGAWGAAVGLAGGEGAPMWVHAALSRVDGQTGVMAESMAVEGSGSSSSGEGRGGKRGVCRECGEVGVEMGVGGLRVEARVATGLQVGALGVLWVAALMG